MNFFRNQIDREALSRAIEYLEAPHEAQWDLSDVPGFVLEPLDFYEPDMNYMKHYEEMQKERITADRMSRSDIRTMFTYFNRGERFCTGFTAEIINNGELLAVYKRLMELS